MPHMKAMHVPYHMGHGNLYCHQTFERGHSGLSTDRYYLNVLWCLADLNQHPSTFWSATLHPLMADEATMLYLKKEDK